MSHPQFPLYIPSKGRFDNALTMKVLDSLGVPYHVVVEEPEYAKYKSAIDPALGTILVLDMEYKRKYDTADNDPDRIKTGAGPARNFAWDHAIANGHKWHWCMDDNIGAFFRYNRNRKYHMADGSHFRIMEEFCLRYLNIAMAGPQYEGQIRRRQVYKPLMLNTRIYSCHLLRNDIPFRWRSRLNDDTDLSLRALKKGWCTVQFATFLQQKKATMTMKGGYNDEFYKDQGRLPASQQLVQMHPDVARVTRNDKRFNRWHHQVDYRPFKKNRLVLRPGVDPPKGIDEMGLHHVPKAAQ